MIPFTYSVAPREVRYQEMESKKLVMLGAERIGGGRYSVLQESQFCKMKNSEDGWW